MHRTLPISRPTFPSMSEGRRSYSSLPLNIQTGRLVSIVVPCRNEVHHVSSLIRNLAIQTLPLGWRMEVIISDGMSEDGTRQAIELLRADQPWLRVIDNPERTVSHGLNRAIRVSLGDVVLRMDVHTEYAPDYVRCCIEVLESTKADNVGGPWRAKGDRYVQRAIAKAFGSRFSSGGARSHDASYRGEVDTVYLGCWRRETLQRIGLFDEDLVRNQDDELNLRIARAGGRIWQDPKIRSSYAPRSSIMALFRQYAQYGYWKVFVIQKHNLPAAPRHLVPGAFVAAVLLLAATAPMFVGARMTLAALLGSYACVLVTVSTVICRRQSDWILLPIMPTVFCAFHIGYGWGFLRGCVDFLVLRRKRNSRYETLTR